MDDEPDDCESAEDSDASGAAEVIDESPRSVADGFVSYLVGCAFGRWDIRIGLNKQKTNGNIDPFSPVPCCPPGFLTNDHKKGSNGSADFMYPISIFMSGIAAESSSEIDDLVARIEQALSCIFELDSESKEQDLLLKLEFSSIREYIRKPTGFFADHLHRYSKSRRKAPIYWPLSTASGTYTL